MIRNMIAFDLGASNGRAILGRFDGERLTMQELHRFENNYIEMNGVFYWDTPYLYSQLKQGLLAFRQGGFGELDSFGIDTWGVDYGLLDKNGHLAGVPRSYRLGVQDDVDAVTARIPADTLYARSSSPPTCWATSSPARRGRSTPSPPPPSSTTPLPGTGTGSPSTSWACPGTSLPKSSPAEPSGAICAPSCARSWA